MNHPDDESGPRATRRSRRVVVAALMVLLAGGVGAGLLLLRSRPRAPLTLAPLDEVVGDPDAHIGKRMRVRGNLVKGTTSRGGDPCEMRFVLESGDSKLPVHLNTCTVPVDYRDEDWVVVTAEGALGSRGVFEADQILVYLNW